MQIMAKQRLSTPTNKRRHKFIFLSIFSVVVLTFYAYLTTDLSVFNPKNAVSIEPSNHRSNLNKTYHILLWTTRTKSPFYHLGTGPSKFIQLDCPYKNCFITDNRTYLPMKEFDAIVFNGNSVITMDSAQLPQERYPEQKFVFGATESAPNKMACKPVLENFFNWTWTYRLDSDIRWSYILIYDLDGAEVGPRIDMEWPNEMKPIEDEETKAILDGKSKAAAWFVTHCTTLGRREAFVDKLKPKLNEYNLTVDVYGYCGDFECPRSEEDKCYDLVKRDYYFYFSFENSFATDYVTEKLLTALNHYTVPVVYGGADYTRYLPPGSYLDARALGPEQLARTMKDIIDNRTRYHDFFRWRNHFRYKRGENDTEICNICGALHDEDKVSTLSVIDNFREWWNEGYNSKCKN